MQLTIVAGKWASRMGYVGWVGRVAECSWTIVAVEFGK